ncbi:brix domain-containing family protein [Salix suchowensis]|nr:brix domain-containing family protein [Salix suchowensis]
MNTFISVMNLCQHCWVVMLQIRHESEADASNCTTADFTCGSGEDLALTNSLQKLIQSLFPQEPNFRGRRVVTFHNQRDYIFFRHHRYISETKESKQSDSKGKNRKDGKGEKNTQQKVIARLQECGPRFTLKLRSLQHETFDTKGGEYEWVHKPEMDTSRRRFFM